MHRRNTVAESPVISIFFVRNKIWISNYDWIQMDSPKTQLSRNKNTKWYFTMKLLERWSNPFHEKHCTVQCTRVPFGLDHPILIVGNCLSWDPKLGHWSSDCDFTAVRACCLQMTFTPAMDWRQGRGYGHWRPGWNQRLLGTEYCEEGNTEKTRLTGNPLWELVSN